MESDQLQLQSRGAARLQRRTRKHRQLVMVTAAMSLTATMAPVLSGVSKAATLGSRAKTPLQQGLAFYRGKTLTVIDPGGTGGPIDTQMRIEAPFISQYLGATVNLVSMSLGNTIQAQDATAASQPNGLTIGYMNTLLDAYDAVTGTPGPNFSPARVAMLGGNTPTYRVFDATAGSPYMSFKQLIKSSSPAAPYKILISTPGAGASILTNLLMESFGVSFQDVGGYSSVTVEEAGFVRGDAPLMMDAINTTGPWVNSGIVRILVNMQPVPKSNSYYGAVASVPTITDLLKEFPPKTALEQKASAAMTAFIPLGAFFYFAPGKTPGYKIDALRAAIKFALTNPAAKARFNTLGDATGFISGPSAKAIYVGGIAAGNKVRSLLLS